MDEQGEHCLWCDALVIKGHRPHVHQNECIEALKRQIRQQDAEIAKYRAMLDRLSALCEHMERNHAA